MYEVYRVSRYEEHVDRRRREMVKRLKKLGSNPGFKRFNECWRTTVGSNSIQTLEKTARDMLASKGIDLEGRMPVHKL